MNGLNKYLCLFFFNIIIENISIFEINLQLFEKQNNNQNNGKYVLKIKFFNKWIEFLLRICDKTKALNVHKLIIISMNTRVI